MNVPLRGEIGKSERYPVVELGRERDEVHCGAATPVG